MAERFLANLRRPVPASSFVAFRVVFGSLVAVGAIRFLLRGWVDDLYLDPEHHLTYPGFDWVRPWSSFWMHLHVAMVATLGVLIAMGVRYRFASACFVVGFAFLELIDRSLYLNHYWFMTLVGILLAVLPAPQKNSDGSLTVSVLNVWMLRFQLGTVYVFAGIAKLNYDWLFRGEPLGTWLAARTDRPLIGPLLDEVWTGHLASWAGALFDLTIVGWLLWRRSRPAAYVVLVAFHLSTALFFQIGLFPWVMIGLSPIFFSPAWLEDRFKSLRKRSVHVRHCEHPLQKWQVVFVAIFVVVGVTLPLRHWFRDGNVRWNDDGYEFSWRVMLTDRTGYLEFDVVDPMTGQIWRVGPDAVLADWQIATAVERPPLALATAHLVADEFAKQLGREVEIYADSFVAMNGRIRQRLIDPQINLASLPRDASASRYVLPMEPPVLR